MIDWTSLLMLAQDAADKAAPDGAPQAPAPGAGQGLPQMLIFIIPIMVVWYVMFIRPQSKERSQRQEMLNSLKKNDSVVTIGGIIGTVSHISEDGKEVTLRVDDNTRLKMQRDAIRDVQRKETPAAT